MRGDQLRPLDIETDELARAAPRPGVPVKPSWSFDVLYQIPYAVDGTDLSSARRGVL